jgi:4-hydroxybenzoate polyprenyltransferase
MSIFAMAAFSNISREITKDIQDLNIDRGHRSTLPLRRGKRNAILVSGSAMIFSILISPVPMILNRPDIVYIAGILVADLILAISIIMIREQPRRSQNIAKLGMFMAAIAFFLWSIG